MSTRVSPAAIRANARAALVLHARTNLEVMERDALRMRVKRPFIFTNLKSGEGVDQIAGFVIEKGGLAKSAA